jgi:DNA replication protein DnaC
MMPTSKIIEDLHALGFRSSEESLTALLKEGMARKWSPVIACERLISLERSERTRRNLSRRTKSATLGQFKALDKFDWNHAKKIDRALYDKLQQLEFVGAGENILLRGPSGLGKTTLAQNLGMTALQAGHTVKFSTLAGALADLLKQESAPALERRIKHYLVPDLLILDEIGYLPADTRSADLLYNIISRRHEKKAMVITTNLAFKEWGTVFPGAACVAALIDRFVQHCHVLDLVGDSYRLKDAEKHRRTSRRRRQTPPS